MSLPAIIVLTGASGAGKTTLAMKLKELGITGVEAINCDRVKLEVDEGEDSNDVQAKTLRYWISRLKEDESNVQLAVLDTQIRPHRALDVLNHAGIKNAEIVLVDCDPVIRNERLHVDRRQPELAHTQMDCWAAYLRGQADALNLAIIDTTEGQVDKSLSVLEALVRDLLNRATDTEVVAETCVAESQGSR